MLSELIAVYSRKGIFQSFPYTVEEHALSIVEGLRQSCVDWRRHLRYRNALSCSLTMSILSGGENIISPVAPVPSQEPHNLDPRDAISRRECLGVILAALTGCAIEEPKPASLPTSPSPALSLTVSEQTIALSPDLGPPPQEPMELPVGNYSHEKKLDPSLSPERYYQKLVETLTTPKLLEEFFRQYWRYNSDEAPGINHPDPSHGVHSINGDRWQTPLQSIKRGLIGDCEDQAFLAAAILRDQGKMGFPIKFEDHAVALWAAYDGMEWVMRSQCNRGQYRGEGKTLSEAYKSWWNEYRKKSSTPNDHAPSSLELMRIEGNKATTSLHPLQILYIQNLADQIDQSRKLLGQGEAEACLDILYKLPLEVKRLPLLTELERIAKSAYWTQEELLRLIETTQKFSR